MMFGKEELVEGLVSPNPWLEGGFSLGLGVVQEQEFPPVRNISSFGCLCGLNKGWKDQVTCPT